MHLTIPEVRLSFWQYLLLSLRFTFQTRPFLLVVLLLSAGSLAMFATMDWQVLSEDWHRNPAGLLMQLFFACVPAFIVWSTWRQYQRSAFLQEAVTYVLHEEGIRVVAPSFRTDLEWEAVVQLRHYGNWLLVQTSVQTALFLDLRRVQPPATPADVLDFFR